MKRIAMAQNVLKKYLLLNATLRTNTTSDDTLWVVSQLESELFNEVVENLSIVVNFRYRKRIRLLAPERRGEIGRKRTILH